MSALPFPVRVAAGLVVTAVEEAQALPRTVAGLPISAVSRVLQVSMRAQQVVTELAIKGDYALDGLRPVEEAPSWARFDDDMDAADSFGTSRFADAVLVEEDVWGEPASAFGRVPSSRLGSAWDAAGADADSGDDTTVNGHDALTGRPGENGGQTTSVTPDALPGYESMTIAQLRGRLRSLSLEQVTELLAWESAHADRPPFVTMLSNRITTLTAEG